MSTKIDIERITSAAAVLSHRDLPPALQAEAEAFLNAHAEALPQTVPEGLATPPSPDELAWVIGEELEFATFLIACYGTVPPISAAGREYAIEESFGIEQNADRRAAINNVDGPVCLPFRVWTALRAQEYARGESALPEAALYPMSDRWAMIQYRIEVPEEFNAWLGSHFDEYYRAWQARRAKTTEAATA